MKRIFSILLILTFLLTGCTVLPSEKESDSSYDDTTDMGIQQIDDADFGFSYQVMSDSVERGERVRISVDLTNQQNVSYAWEGPYSFFRANVKLVCVDSDNSFTLSPEPTADTDDFGKHEIAPGEKRSFSYYFNIPADAELGSYSLICSFGETVKEFKHVFELDK
ncbi:MAG: hypothetical protein PUE85_08230 [Firmicutes bacterium]|nr:hypothetical protein [Bacillota bacterium]